MAEARGAPIRFTDLVRGRAREHRTARGWTREDLAGSARQLGLDWTEGTVRHIEDGTRGVGDDLVALLLIFGIGAGDFFGTQGPRVIVPGRILEGPSELGEIFGGTYFKRRRPYERWVEKVETETGPRTSDQKAAKALGLTVTRLEELTKPRWGRYFTEEREARLDAQVKGREVSPRSRQALRGHITRSLLDELRDVLEDTEDVGGGDG